MNDLPIDHLLPGAGRLRMTAPESEARSSVAQRVRGCSFDWGNEAWSLSLQPLQAVALTACGAQDWRVSVRWRGAPFELAVPSAAVQEWLAVRFPLLALPALPRTFVGAAVEAACQGLLESCALLRQGAAQVESVRAGPAPASELPHVFELSCEHGGHCLNAVLSTSSLGLLQMGRAAQALEPLAGPLEPDDLPLTLRLEVGFTWLGRRQIAGLRPGDAVLVEELFLDGQGGLRLGCEDWGLRVRWDGSAVVVESVFTRGGWIMPDEDDVDEDLADLGGLPMRLVFDVGSCRMTLRELQAMQPGQVLELGRPLSHAVQLRVNGALVGTGELVEIDGRTAVSLTSVARRAAVADGALSDWPDPEAADAGGGRSPAVPAPASGELPTPSPPATALDERYEDEGDEDDDLADSWLEPPGPHDPDASPARPALGAGGTATPAAGGLAS